MINLLNLITYDYTLTSLWILGIHFLCGAVLSYTSFAVIYMLKENEDDTYANKALDISIILSSLAVLCFVLVVLRMV